MAQNITWLGASYSNVPWVTLPKTGGGIAKFSDASVTTAVASDVASGKKFLLADGSEGTGTNSGGGGSSMQLGFSESSTNVATSLSFSGLDGEPTSFSIVSATDISTGTPSKIAAIVFDGTNIHAQTITNTGNAQVSYDGSNLSKSYSNGTLTIVSTGAQFVTGQNYWMSYTYGGTAGNIQTEDVQVGSGATSITFTGLSDEPECWSCIFKSNFSTSNGYQRVICVRYDGEIIEGMAMDSAAHYSDGSWNYSYNNGSLTISSVGTNNGGYFHQPGYYQLTYAVAGSGGNYQSKTVTPTTSQQVVQADSGYDALKKVTVNAIPSQYIVPTGNIAITSNTTGSNTLDVSQYATATVNVPTGGGSVQYDTKTATASDYPTSLSFTSMKGQPKFFVVRLNAQVSSSGSTTYYYIVDVVSNGTTTHGNCFRIGSTRRVDNITSGYSWTYSGTTLTITSSAASRSASPGAFYSGSYELMYAY